MHWQNVLGGLGLLTLCVATACGRTVSDPPGDTDDDDSSDTDTASTGNAATGGGGSGGNASSGASSGGNGGSGAGATGGGGAGGTGASSSGGAPNTTTGGFNSTGVIGVGGVVNVTTVGSVTAVTTTGVSTSGFGSVTTTGGIGGGTMVDYHPIPIPDDCLTQYASTSTEYCELQLSCSERYQYTTCWWQGTDWYCDCSAETYQSYTMSGVAAVDVCPYMASVCMGTTATEFGDFTCTPNYQEATSTWCSMDATCTRSAEPDEGVTVNRNEWRYAYCNLTEPGSWSCECDVGGRYLQITMEDVASSATVCGDMLGWCGGENVVREGTPSCTPTYQSAGIDYCSADMQCTQPVTVNGQSATLVETLPVSCSPAGDGNWTCQCGTTGSVDVLGTEVAWDACTEATSLCADALSM